MTLYDLTGQLLLLRDMAEDPDIDPETLRDTMEGVEGELEVKAEGYARVIQDLKAASKALEEEEKRLNAKRKVINKNVDRMKAELLTAMQASGKSKFSSGPFTFSLRKNPAALVIDRPDDIPAEYLIPQPPAIDREGIKKAVRDGESYDWCHLEQGKTLIIN